MDMRSTQWAVAVVCIGLAAGALVSTALTLAAGYLPLMFWDQWEAPSMYAAIEAGQWGYQDWLKQHNEHRIVFPRLIYWADLAWFDGSDKFNLSTLALIQLGHGLLLSWLLIQATEMRRPLAVGASALIVAATIALAQIANLRWGFQVAFVGVYAAGSAAIVAATHAARGSYRWLCGCVAFALVTSFCMANGVLIWPTIIAAALLTGAQRRVVFVLAACGLLTITLYLIGYSTPVHHAPPLAHLQQPDQLIAYLITYLGNPLQSLGTTVAQAFGAVSLVFLCWFAVSQAWRERSPKKSTVALLAIAGFVVLSGAMTAVGRLQFGVEQALEGRYATPAIVYWVSVLGLGGFAASKRRSARFALGIVTATCVVALGLTQVSEFGKRNEYLIRKAPAYTALIAGAEDTKALERVAALPWNELMDRVGTLKRYDKHPFLGSPAALVGQRLTDGLQLSAEPCEGEITSIKAVANDKSGYRVFGWIWHRESASAPSWIALTRTDDGIVEGVGRAGFPRPHIAKAFDHIDDTQTGWYGHAGGTEASLQAYGLMHDGTSACLIGPVGKHRASSQGQGKDSGG